MMEDGIKAIWTWTEFARNGTGWNAERFDAAPYWLDGEFEESEHLKNLEDLSGKPKNYGCY